MGHSKVGVQAVCVREAELRRRFALTNPPSAHTSTHLTSTHPSHISRLRGSEPDAELLQILHDYLTDNTDLLREYFRMTDRDGNGRLDHGELARFVAEIPGELTAEDRKYLVGAQKAWEVWELCGNVWGCVSLRPSHTDVGYLCQNGWNVDCVC